MGFFANIAVSSVYPWFSKKQSMALSIVMIGVPIGAFIWPPFVSWLNHEYSWKGAFIIVGGIQLQGLVFLALLHKPKVNKINSLPNINIADKCLEADITEISETDEN